MKHIYLPALLLIGLFFLNSNVSGLASEEKKKQQQKSSNAMPIYKPPLRGAPVGRVGGGTRGLEGEMLVLTALVPNHVGLTVQKQPVLYWYLSKEVDKFMEFTLNDKHAKQTLVKRRFEPPVREGIHRISLEELEISLSTGRCYEWFVALIPDQNRRSKDITSGGRIEFTGPAKTLQEELDKVKKEDYPHVYAGEGIWYDALSAISDLIDAAPDNPLLQKQMAALLEQVGLSSIPLGP